MNIEIGSKVCFRDYNDELVWDMVRDKFNYYQLLEPYERNTIIPAVVLTNHSWIPIDWILDIK